jgi:subtilisin family serine protease
MSRRRFIALVSSAALLAALLPGAAGAEQPTSPVGAKPPVVPSDNGIYIVQMVEQPVVAYDGEIAGYRSTRPAEGTKVDPHGADVSRYASELHERHRRAAASVGGEKLYDYVYAFNGFAAEMTQAEAAKLSARADVVSVTPDEMQTVDTSSTPAFLGLVDARRDRWTFPSTGEDVIIGVIDSGVWPESLSFADRVDKKSGAPSTGRGARSAYDEIHGWHGACTAGDDFTTSLCNDKLIGAQYFNAAWGGDAGIDATMPWEFNSARDFNGHGTHTASTAGGNRGVTTTGPATAFGKISGIAPRARIAMYKALWSTQDGSEASGRTSDLVAAVDQAVADGVDVINYSISGTLTNLLDPVEIAFLNAADAGVFVAASAGNEGPDPSTVAHPSPWITTVAAGTHNRSVSGSVTLGNGATYSGASVAAAAVTAPLVDSTAAGMSGADANAVRLCYSTATDGGTPVLDPAMVAGKIIVCDRGESDRVDKSLAVKEAGGVGMILLNPSGNTLNADFHSVPTVHLQDTDYTAVHAYAATTGATATINKAVFDYKSPAPYTESFSSRGPLVAGAGDVLKPDLMAPGQDILAAVSPASGGGLDFNVYSGTSMSSPHVAGLAALLKDLHPRWSPMAIKSALMTTAYDVLDGPSTDPAVIFSQGAGHVKPTSAADPGLVFDSKWNDWLAFLCGTTTAVGATTCDALTTRGYPTDPSGFNSPSIAIGSLAGAQTVTRTVTNVGERSSKYRVSITGLSGINVSVSPATFRLEPREKQKLTITITRTEAALNVYGGGSIIWTDGRHQVRIPVVVQPVALAAPAEVSGSYSVAFGHTGEFTATARGLVPATTFTGSISTGEFPCYDVDVTAGTTYARFSTFDATTTPASDLDLYVFRESDPPKSPPAGSSGGPTSQEEVSFLNPAADAYRVCVDGFATANPSTFTLFAWLLGSTDEGNMTVTAPASAALGTTGAINLSFSGLTAGTKYLGSVAYGGSSGMPNPTIVRVDVP